ncbi:MAG: OmpH family outer membrane protein [Acidobacteria bacterium]|nr:OmpH family outer membrane protein [Acidobacteriota bacterium]
MKALFAVLGMVTLIPAFGQEGPVKIGIVDADIVIQESIKGKRFFQEFEQFGKQKSDEIQARVSEYSDKEKDYKNKVNSLSEDKRREMVVQLQNLEKDIKRMQEDAKQESDRRLNDALSKFRKELGPVIQAVAEEMKLDIIINHGPQSNLVYFNARVDITDAVIKKYDESAE